MLIKTELRTQVKPVKGDIFPAPYVSFIPEELNKMEIIEVEELNAYPAIGNKPPAWRVIGRLFAGDD